MPDAAAALAWIGAQPSSAVRLGLEGSAPVSLTELEQTGLAAGERNVMLYRGLCSAYRTWGTGPDGLERAGQWMDRVLAATADRSGFTNREALAIQGYALAWVSEQERHGRPLMASWERKFGRYGT
jgi:hypothetical protein